MLNNNRFEDEIKAPNVLCTYNEGEGEAPGGALVGGWPGEGGPGSAPCPIGHICTAKFYTDGSLVEVNRNIRGGGHGSSKRGKITEFSLRARRRMMKVLGTVSKAGMPLFATLTYSDHFPVNNPDRWALDKKLLDKEIYKRGLGVIWKKEPKQRKSGDNKGEWAPHYHMLVWGCSEEELMAWLPYRWFEIAGNGDENHLKWHLGLLGGSNKPCVSKARSWNGVSWYVAKYMAKNEDDLEAVIDVGRFWGVTNARCIPWSRCIEMTLENKVANNFFRLMRRRLHVRRRSFTGLFLLSNSPAQWMRAVMFC